MKISTINHALLSVCVFFVCFSFPLQVFASSPLPALIPYCILLLLMFFQTNQRKGNSIWHSRSRSRIVTCVIFYLILILFNTSWQLAFGYIELNEAINAVVIYSLPTLFFFYFISRSTDIEFKVVFIAIFVSGLLLSAWYVYDSYAMLGQSVVSNYSIRAFEYSQIRSDAIYPNDARISAGYRSHGLLESHSVSSAWVAFAGFAALSLIDRWKPIQRVAVIIIFWSILIACQNYTAIVAFITVQFIIEFEVGKIFRGVILVKTVWAIILLLIFIFTILVGAILFFDNHSFIEAVFKNAQIQFGFISGQTDYKDGGYFYTLLSSFTKFLIDPLNSPISFLIGDGFSSFGLNKGGDLGLVESLHRFGLPFFILFFGGSLILVFRGVSIIYVKKNSACLEYKLIWFAVTVTLYLLLNEVHYSVWTAKSVLPIFFICLAIFERFLNSRKLFRLSNKMQLRFE